MELKTQKLERSNAKRIVTRKVNALKADLRSKTELVVIQRKMQELDKAFSAFQDVCDIVYELLSDDIDLVTDADTYYTQVECNYNDVLDQAATYIERQSNHVTSPDIPLSNESSHNPSSRPLPVTESQLARL